jgi:hypothetical protein
MRPLTTLSIAAAVALAAGLWASPVHAQGKTYPSTYGLTPSPSYYQMPNANDRDTYLNPNPFPAYNSTIYQTREYGLSRPSLPYRPARTYSEPTYSAAYPPTAYPPPAPPPVGFNRYYAASPSFGYYYEGPFVYSHYDRSGRMAFRYGWW